MTNKIPLKFFKKTKAEVDDMPVVDGQILYTTDTKEHFIDHEDARIKIDTQSTDDLTEGAINKYDKTINLNAGTGISITGSYPNFTVTNTNQGGGSSSNGFEMPVGTIMPIMGTLHGWIVGVGGTWNSWKELKNTTNGYADTIVASEYPELAAKMEYNLPVLPWKKLDTTGFHNKIAKKAGTTAPLLFCNENGYGVSAGYICFVHNGLKPMAVEIKKDELQNSSPYKGRKTYIYMGYYGSPDNPSPSMHYSTDAKYLGEFATAPTGTFNEEEKYFNTTSNLMFTRSYRGTWEVSSALAYCGYFDTTASGEVTAYPVETVAPPTAYEYPWKDEAAKNNGNCGYFAWHEGLKENIVLPAIGDVVFKGQRTDGYPTLIPPTWEEGNYAAMQVGEGSDSLSLFGVTYYMYLGKYTGYGVGGSGIVDTSPPVVPPVAPPDDDDMPPPKPENSGGG